MTILTPHKMSVAEDDDDVGCSKNTVKFNPCIKDLNQSSRPKQVANERAVKLALGLLY